MGADADTTIPTKPKRTSTSTLRSVKGSPLAGLGNFIKLLPTGTVFLFHFFNPLLSNYGECGNSGNVSMTKLLIAICGITSVFSCFTDSYFGIDGEVHYGIVTTTGMWPDKAPGMADLSQYKLRIEDFVHATFSCLVYGALAFTDRIMVRCFYHRDYWKEHKAMLMVLPAVVGLFSSFVFMIFPSKRHGIGYPSDAYPDIPDDEE